MTAAGIDIGTNSVRLLIVDEQGGELVRDMNITRLGQGVDKNGALAPEAIKRTLGVLAEYGEHLRAHNVRALRMTATSAARDAANRNEFFAGVAAHVGQEPELISGEEEARLSFAGATTSLPPEQGPFLIFDIGGGSTEFAIGTDSPNQFISVNMGGVRMTERFLKTDPPTEAELEATRAFVRSELNQVSDAVDVAQARTWLGLAGTVTSCAAWAAQLSEYDAEVTHGYVLSARQVRAFLVAMSSVSTEARRKLLVNPKRADVIVGGAIVLDVIVDHFGIKELVVSERDILDGLAATAQA